MKKKSIAAAIGVSNSTISRELKRNGGKNGSYDGVKAHRETLKRRHKSAGNRTVSDDIKKTAIDLLVRNQWSPEQISGAMAKEGKRISHETIYKIIREDKRKQGSLYKNCRHRLKHRARPVGGGSPIKDRLSIHQRPKEADGTRFGDIEMDLIVGRNNQEAILTMIERKTNYLWMKLLPHGKDAKEVAREVCKILRKHKACLKTITTDNGPEFAAHKAIMKAIGINVYFADPFSSWQKGTIENANGLIRQYIQKGTSFRELDDRKIKEICRKINDRPRKKLKFCTPSECFSNNSC